MKEAFEIIVLGCGGGPFENNLTGFLLSPLSQKEWIALDAGSVLWGIVQAYEQNHLTDIEPVDSQLHPACDLFINQIKAFLISHAHLDHIVALVVNSQIDKHKYILGIDPTIDNLRDHIFNGLIWPNYGNEGREPILKLYSYLRLALHQKKNIPGTTLQTEAYLLSHPGGYPSTAFLIEHQDAYFLYVGDTASDFLENEKHLTRLWKRIAPLLQRQKLHGMVLECSYAQMQAEQVMYGHLNSKLMLKELRHLQEIAGVPLKDFKILVSHRKESAVKSLDTKQKIQEEILSLNDLEINFLFPKQGDRYTF